MARYLIDECQFVLARGSFYSNKDIQRIKTAEKRILYTCGKNCTKCCCKRENCDIIQWIKDEIKKQPTDTVFYLSTCDKSVLQDMKNKEWEKRFFQLTDGPNAQTLTKLMRFRAAVPLPLNFVSVGCAKCAQLEHVHIDRTEPHFRCSWWHIVTPLVAKELKILFWKKKFPHVQAFENLLSSEIVDLPVENLSETQKKAFEEIEVDLGNSNVADLLTNKCYH